MGDLLTQIGLLFDSTRNDTVWHITKLRNLPPLTTQAGRRCANGTEVKVEITMDAMRVAGMDARRLVAAARVWNNTSPAGQGAAADGSSSPGAASSATPLPAAPAAAGAGTVSAQSTQTLTKPVKERCHEVFDWPIAGQMNKSGLAAAALGPQPGSFGWSIDGINLDGENVNPGIAYLGHVKQIVYLPPAVPGSHSRFCVSLVLRPHTVRVGRCPRAQMCVSRCTAAAVYGFRAVGRWTNRRLSNPSGSPVPDSPRNPARGGGTARTRCTAGIGYGRCRRQERDVHVLVQQPWGCWHATPP